MSSWGSCRLVAWVSLFLLPLLQSSSMDTATEMVTSTTESQPYDLGTMRQMLRLVRNAKGMSE